MDHRTEMFVKGGLALLSLAVVWLMSRSWRRAGTVPPRAGGATLGVLATVAALAFTNFTYFHGTGLTHDWELFHYVLGSKYFPELGYDGLYVASVQAQKESLGTIASQPNLRDLRSNDVVPTDSLSWPILEVRQRFTPERWKSFVADNGVFLARNDPQYMYRIRTDHGFNPTPAWTFVARLFSAHLPVTASSLKFLASIDLILISIAFLLLFRTFGTRVGSLALVVFGLGYAWRWDWNGGAFLRWDWLAAVILSVCALERRRFAAAGGLLAYAAAMRFFPALFLLGPAVLGLRALVRKEADRRWPFVLFGSFGLSLALLAGAGGLAGRGPGAWKEFAGNFQKHQKSWLTNNVGLKNLFLYQTETVKRELVDWAQPEPWRAWQRLMDERSEHRRVAIAAGQIAVLALLVVAAMRLSPAESVLLGLGAIWALGLLTCYYWAMLLLVPVKRGTRLTEGVLAMSLGLFALDFVTPAFEAIYGFMSVAVGILTVGFALAVIFGAARPAVPSPEPAEGRPARRSRGARRR